MAELGSGSTIVVGERRYRVASIGIEKAFDPSQPRDNIGRWTSTGAAVDPAKVPGAAHAGSIPAYLDMIANKMHGGRPSVEGFILHHGKGYPMDSDSFIGGKMHRCYENTTKAVMLDDSLTYVEGYVSVHGVPVHHAWAVDAEGKVRDYTIESGKGIKGYFGVPLKTDYIISAQLRRGRYGVLVHERRDEVVGADPGEIIRKVFDPSQPRDEDGKWTEAGGGARRNKLPETDDEVTQEIIDQLPAEARTPEGAEAYFSRRMGEMIRQEHVVFYHEAPGDHADSFRREGIRSEYGVFASVGVPSEFVTSREKTIVRFRAPPSQTDHVSPDMRYYGLNKLSAEQMLLLEHPDITGAYVSFPDAIPPRWIVGVEARR